MKSLGGLNGLLCSSTLRSTLGSQHGPGLNAREGLKDLLLRPQNLQESPHSKTPLAQDSSAVFKTDPNLHRWERCLALLVEDFISRKGDLLRLNKARREQIEAYLRSYSGNEISLEKAIQGRLGSPEQEALQLFASQCAAFHLLQILLVKRWEDRGFLLKGASVPDGHTLNWQITSFLKKYSKQGLINRHDWSFLKQNTFSWYSPSKDTWERIRLLLETTNLSKEPSDFPARILAELGASSRLSQIGFSAKLIAPHLLWKLLLEQKASDERLNSISELAVATGDSGPILISGLSNGESLNALRGLSSSQELHGVWAYSDSEFERFLSEIFILWDCSSEIPRINLFSRAAMRELSRSHKGNNLFHDGSRIPMQAQFAACFPSAGGNEIEDAAALLEPLRENGLLLVASDIFWPTDSSEKAERLRDQVLKHASIRLIVDLRQLSVPLGESLPKGIVLLEKCESRELRDSNRPQLLRARGYVKKAQINAFWDSILEHVRMETNPGEVSVRLVSGIGDGVKIEAMAAAASQQQLKNTPWVTLSDPRFYEASARLRRSLHKAHTFGTVLRWKNGMSPPSRRGILLREDGRHLQAFLPSNEEIEGEIPQFLFLPESSVAEHPAFFLSQIYSAPVQFWFSLETEQGTTKKLKGFERQTEQRLKLMPLLRLFEPGTLLAAPSSSSYPFASLDETRSELARIFRQTSRGMAENSKLHEIILSLEGSISQNIKTCSEFTQYLFPNLKIRRWELPSSLPEVAPKQAFEIFSHLDSSSLSQHPAIQISRIRSAQDFKVSNTELKEISPGISELKVFNGIDPALRLAGPSLILRASNEEILKRLGRPWRETAERLRFPTDIRLVLTQLREVVKSAESQLNLARDHIAIMDQIFCCLFGLSSSFNDDNVRQSIRHHLSPEDARISVQFAKEAPYSVTPAVPESPIRILQ